MFEADGRGGVQYECAISGEDAMEAIPGQLRVRQDGYCDAYRGDEKLCGLHEYQLGEHDVEGRRTEEDASDHNVGNRQNMATLRWD